MVKLEFPGNLVKNENGILCNALIAAVKEKAPQMFEILEREGMCSFLYHVCAVVYPKNCTNIDAFFFSFSFWSRKNCIIWLPGKLKNTERKSFVSTFKDAIIYTPKGSETDRFFRASSFPKEVRNGYPKIGGKTIVPDEKLYIWMDDGREKEECEPDATEQKHFEGEKKAGTRTKALQYERRNTGPATNLWSFIPAVLGLVIAVIILVVMLKTLN